MSQVRVVASLALLYMLRMVGLFMVLPVLALYGEQYEGASIALLGLALGIYGLSQAALQIPMGLLSDIWGRKPVILLGLIIFILGSLVAALSSTVEGLIIGRSLQGAGAIAGAVMALVADLSEEKNRTKAMAVIGASIGVSFALALAIGPSLAAWGGIQSVFFGSSLTAAVGILVLYFVVPAEPTKNKMQQREPLSIWATFSDAQLLRLNWGIFTLHAILMSFFIIVPSLLEGSLGVARESHWLVYLVILFGSFVCILPVVSQMDKRNWVKPVFLLSILGLAFSLAVLTVFLSLHIAAVVWFSLFLFFMAFNLLEASLPSLVSKLAPAKTKGTAMGVYSTSQFFGAFVGGVLGGLAVQVWGVTFALLMNVALALIWVLIASGMSTAVKPQAAS